MWGGLVGDAMGSPTENPRRLIGGMASVGLKG